MLDTNIDRTQRHVHACMSEGFMPDAMHEEAEKNCFRVIVVLVVGGIQHALQCYITKQTVEPDGEVQEVRRLCSNAYADMAYGLKCEQISLLPQLAPDFKDTFLSHYLLRRSHMMFYNPL